MSNAHIHEWYTACDGKYEMFRLDGDYAFVVLGIDDHPRAFQTWDDALQAIDLDACPETVSHYKAKGYIVPAYCYLVADDAEIEASRLAAKARHEELVLS